MIVYLAAYVQAAKLSIDAPSSFHILISPSASHHRAQIPGHEFVLSVTVQFALALLSRCGIEDHLEKSLADRLDRRTTVDDFAAVDVDVFFLALPQRGVGGELQRWRRRAAIGGAAPGGKADHVGAAGDLPRCRDRVIAGSVHVDEA